MRIDRAVYIVDDRKRTLAIPSPKPPTGGAERRRERGEQAVCRGLHSGEEGWNNEDIPPRRAPVDVMPCAPPRHQPALLEAEFRLEAQNASPVKKRGPRRVESRPLMAGFSAAHLAEIDRVIQWQGAVIPEPAMYDIISRHSDADMPMGSHDTWEPVRASCAH